MKWSEKWCDTVLERAVIQNSNFYKDYCFWIFKSMITELFWLTYNESLNGHQGQDWTKSQIEFYYYWPTLYHNIDCYIFNCIIYKCVKTSWQKPVSLLHFLEILQKCWQDFFCNFITNLSESEDINVIFTIINKFSKKWHYIPCCTENK